MWRFTVHCDGRRQRRDDTERNLLSSCSPNNLAGGFSNTVRVSADSAGSGPIEVRNARDQRHGRFVAFASAPRISGAPRRWVWRTKHIGARTPANAAHRLPSPSTTMFGLIGGGNSILGTSQLPSISDDGRVLYLARRRRRPWRF